MAKNEPRAPKTYQRFRKRYPQLGKAWDAINEAGRAGPLNEREARLCKLAVALGNMREGAVHSNVRKALAEGIKAEEMEQVVALCASTLGMPATAAVFTWVNDILDAR